MIEAILGFTVGWVIGRYGRRIAYIIRTAKSMRRQGICFNYRGKGYRETINGTNSEFCANCGHPAGYHWLTLPKLLRKI